MRGVQLSVKDMIGDSAIKTTKRGGPALDKALKGSMPKDVTYVDKFKVNYCQVWKSIKL